LHNIGWWWQNIMLYFYCNDGIYMLPPVATARREEKAPQRPVACIISFSAWRKKVAPSPDNVKHRDLFKNAVPLQSVARRATGGSGTSSLLYGIHHQKYIYIPHHINNKNR
jgi:hypothetical protein